MQSRFFLQKSFLANLQSQKSKRNRFKLEVLLELMVLGS